MRIKTTLLLLITCVVCTYAQFPLVFDVENRGTSCNVTAGALSTNSKLPDPFSFTSGGRVSTFEDWSCRRNEIKADIEKYEIGVKPNKPASVTASYSGGTLTVTVKENGQTLTLTSKFSVPSGNGLHPIVIGMNSGTGGLSASLFNGVVQVPFNHDQVVSYAAGSGSRNTNDPFYKLYPNLNNSGKYCGWSWGISRLIDGLELVADELNLDISKIAVTGCSYAGKMALFGGAFDERIALTLAQESGGGGINAWRLSQDFNTRTGTNIEKINNTNGSWFMQSMMNLDPYKLPHDHHELIAMIAPRAVLILGNPDMIWLGDESGYKSTMAALEVWKAMGVEDRLGFDFSGGHNHCAAATSQNTSVTTFVDKFLRNKSTNTSIRIRPVQNGFDFNYQSSIDWTTPKITSNPNLPKVTITSPVATGISISAPINIEATVEDANNDVTKVEFFVNVNKIGEDNASPYAYSWTPTEGGEYTISVKVTDAENNTATAQKVVKVRAPFNGTPHLIPGTIEIEEYDLGGEGLGYHEANASGNEGGGTFRNDEVDIENCTDTDEGYNLGYVLTNEWLAYSVDVQATGIYSLDLRVAVNGSNRVMHLEIDDNDISGPISLPNTGGWQAWETITLDNISLNEGPQNLKLVFDSDYLNLNYMSFDLSIPTGLDNDNNIQAVCFPNPFTEELTIKLAGEFTYEINDIHGKSVEKGKGLHSTVVGSHLTNGLYFVSISNSIGTDYIKIIKK